MKRSKHKFSFAPKNSRTVEECNKAEKSGISAGYARVLLGEEKKEKKTSIKIAKELITRRENVDNSPLDEDDVIALAKPLNAQVDKGE